MYNVVKKREKLSRARLEELLAEHGIAPAGDVSNGQMDDIRRLRTRLRAVFAGSDAEAVQQLNAMLDEAGCTPQLVRHGGEPWHLHVSSAGQPLLGRVTAAAALGLLLVVRDQDMGRLQFCAGTNCSDVFVDVSRNRSRRYCSPRICGNRAHARAYRERRKNILMVDAT